MNLSVSTSSKTTQNPASVTVIDIDEVDSNKLDLVKTFPNTRFLKYALPRFKKLHFNSRSDVAWVDDFISQEDFSSLFMEALHQAFVHHIPFTLSPEVVWYLICHEMAIHVKQNSNKYAALFTKKIDEKQLIRVEDDSLRYGDPDNDWAGCIHLFVDPMKHLIGEKTVNFFLPKLTTATDESRTAILVSFMDMVSVYYLFECVTLCGIPRVIIKGQAQDWQLLQQRTTKLAETFKELNSYFQNLLPILKKIAKAADGEKDIEFWKSIYKFNHDSGGPYITGWINTLFAYMTGSDYTTANQNMEYKSKLKNDFNWRKGHIIGAFPMHISKVDFNWLYFGKPIPMFFASGILGIDFENGSLSPKLGYAVCEYRDPK